MPDSPAEKSLRRVLFISAMDGWSVALFAGLCTFISLLGFEWIGIFIGGIITACGVLELRGRRQIIDGNAGGLKWLVRAQVIILVTVLLYASENLLAYNEAALLAEITPEIRNAMSQAGISFNDLRPMLKPVYFGLYLTVIGLTILFQGGLALYYQSRRTKVAAAVEERRRRTSGFLTPLSPPVLPSPVHPNNPALPMPAVLVILPEGFEELEAVAPIDLLRRAQVNVTVASLSGNRAVIGRNALTLHADTTLAEVGDRLFDLLLLPGGPGVKLLRADPRVRATVLAHHAADRWLAAICAAPTVLNDAGLLAGRRYTAHFSVANELPSILSDERTVTDGRLLTSRGAGTSIDFGLLLVTKLVSPEISANISQSICA